MSLIRPIYVCYYDCTGWNSNVEIMNLQNDRGACVINVFRRLGGAPVWSSMIGLTAHETKNVSIDAPVPRHEGMVTVSPENERYKGWEFPSVLKIYAAGGIIEKELRYVPFIRVP